MSYVGGVINKFITGTFAGLVFEYLSLQDRIAAGNASKRFYTTVRTLPVRERVNERYIIWYISMGFPARLFTNIFTTVLTDKFSMFPRLHTLTIDSTCPGYDRLVFHGVHRLNLRACLGKISTVETSARIVNIDSDIFINAGAFSGFGILTVELGYAEIAKIHADRLIVTGRVDKLYVRAIELDVTGCEYRELILVGYTAVEGELPEKTRTSRDEFKKILPW